MKKYVHKESGGEIIVRDDVQEAAVIKFGYEFVEEVTEETPKKK
jgi:hypothetical protein